MGRLRVAWVCPYVPAPENSGGRIRIARMARAFAEAGDELVLYARRASDDGEQALEEARRGPWAAVHVARPDAVRLPGRAPEIARGFPRSLRQRLAEDDRARPFDLAVVEHSYAALGLPRLARAAEVLVDHNVESAYWLRRFRAAAVPRPGDALRWLRWRAFERRAWRRADLLTMVTDEDARAASRAGLGRDALVIPNGVAAERFRFAPPSERAGSKLLFVGTMSYEPNVAAAERAALEVLPRLRRLAPGASLTIAGRDPSPRVRRLEGEGVRVTGTVADLGRLFDEHAAYLNLVSTGAGSSLKVLEPLVAGLPLVAAPFAVRGFPLEAGRHFLEARDPESAAASLARALSPEGRAELDAMAGAARELALGYDWRIGAARFRAAVLDLLRERGGARKGASRTP